MDPGQADEQFQDVGATLLMLWLLMRLLVLVAPTALMARLLTRRARAQAEARQVQMDDLSAVA
jgi:hypothetical protein